MGRGGGGEGQSELERRLLFQVMTLLGQFLQGRGYPYLRLGTPEYHRSGPAMPASAMPASAMPASAMPASAMPASAMPASAC